MSNQTIDGVPRELLERLSGLFTGGKHRIGVEALHELRALLDEPIHPCPVRLDGCDGSCAPAAQLAPVAHTMQSVMKSICRIDGFPMLTSNQCHALAVKLNEAAGLNP